MKKDTVLSLLVIAATAVAAVYVYQSYGLKGSAVLISFWLALYAGSKFVVVRAEKRMRNILLNTPWEERQKLIDALSEEDREEVMKVVEKTPELQHLKSK